MMAGFGSLGEAELSEALEQACLAEGVTRDRLVSVDIIGDEISVRHLRFDGLSRTGTYPIAAILTRHMERSVGPSPAE